MSAISLRAYLGVVLVAFLCFINVSGGEHTESIIRGIEYDLVSRQLKDNIRSGKVSAGDVADVVRILGKEERLRESSLTRFLKMLADICSKKQFARIGSAILTESSRSLLPKEQSRLKELYSTLAKSKGMKPGMITASASSSSRVTGNTGMVNPHNAKLWDKQRKGGGGTVANLGETPGGDGDGVSKK